MELPHLGIVQHLLWLGDQRLVTLKEEDDWLVVLVGMWLWVGGCERVGRGRVGWGRREP